ncbi:hypothetical protein LCGC14_2594900 [marine sediment metagenome]|uniref:Uncharacterized protein n=1 Tax=marine sediment metagenome TaxID=412755 RepID=A0A0F9CLI8_9ZZZZ
MFPARDTVRVVVDENDTPIYDAKVILGKTVDADYEAIGELVSKDGSFVFKRHFQIRITMCCIQKFYTKINFLYSNNFMIF